jgi:hypothetical protein
LCNATDVRALQHEVRGVTDDRARDGDLVVVGHIHEHEGFAILVQVLELATVDDLGLDFRAGVEGAVHGLTRNDVLDLGAHEGAALARLHVLELDHGPKLAVHVEDDAVPDVSG